MASVAGREADRARPGQGARMTRHEWPMRHAARQPLACVMGGMDLVRPLGLAGIDCAAVTRPGGPSLYSRFTRTGLRWSDFGEDTDALVEALLRFAAREAAPPVLFYEEDAHLLLVSRYRDQLAPAFRFVIAERMLVEDLVDKARFQALA